MDFDLVDSLKKFEGFSPVMYKCPAGKWSIGYGRNLEREGALSQKDIEYWEKVVLTKEEATTLLMLDIAEAEMAADRFIVDYNLKYLNEARRKVIISMIFQLGASKIRKFVNFIEALKIGDWDLAAMEMLESKWRNQTAERVKFLSEVMLKG